jgi:methionyl-tRNA formyltransferase
MFIEPTLDTGPILLQSQTRIRDRETAPELMARLAEIGSSLLSDTLAQLGTLEPRIQDDSLATFAPILKKEDGIIDWTKSAASIDCLIRGFQPWPNAHTTFKAHGLTIWSGEPLTKAMKSGEPGAIIEAHGDQLLVQCGDQTALRLLEVQPEAKRRMSARDFLNGAHLKIGDRFGQS